MIFMENQSSSWPPPAAPTTKQANQPAPTSTPPIRRPKRNIFIFFLIILFSTILLIFWLNKREQISDNSQRQCDRERIMNIVENRNIFASEVTNLLNDDVNNLSWGVLQIYFLKYIFCEIAYGEDNENTYQLGMDFINNPSIKKFAPYQKYPEVYEKNQKHNTAYFDLALDLSTRKFDEEIRPEKIDYKENKRLLGLLLNYDFTLSEMCPYLSEVCINDELRKQILLPESICDDLCERSMAYDEDRNLLIEEVVIGNFKDWENGDMISDWPFLRYVLAHRYGGQELVDMICDYMPPEERDKCLFYNSGTKNMINILGRNLSCEMVQDEITNFMCSNFSFKYTK